MNARDFAAYRASAMLECLLEQGNIPECHKAHAQEIVNAYRKADEAIKAEKLERAA